MVTWKVILVVIVIVALAITVGMWFGYQYVSEQEDIAPEGWHVPSDTMAPRYALPLAFSPLLSKVLIG